MKKLTGFCFAVFVVMGLSHCDQQKGTADNGALSGGTGMDLTKENHKFSYAVGLDVGSSLEQIKDEIAMDALVKGIKDAVNGQEHLISDEDAMGVKQAFMEKMQEKAKQSGEDFLAQNKNKDGIITTSSGLQYEVITPGEGEKPGPEDKVSVHYSGKLIDGKEFDSSIKRGEPASFQVKGVIPGWTEGLQLMNKGSKYKFYIPSDLAYGPRGAGRSIPPNSALIFEVELLDVIKAENPAGNK